jgi:hypothetical protein
MIYSSYKSAALKHLQGCKLALNGLKLSTAHGSISGKMKADLLMEIFYLSGYTIECSVNYAIYKRVGWLTRPVYDLFDISKSVSYSKPTSGSPISFWISQHKFHKNLQLLSTLLPGGNQVPLVDSSIHVPANLRRMIFDPFNGTKNHNHWRPELRYESNTIFTETDIEAFVQLSEDFYIKILSVT